MTALPQPDNNEWVPTTEQLCEFLTLGAKVDINVFDRAIASALAAARKEALKEAWGAAIKTTSEYVLSAGSQEGLVQSLVWRRDYAIRALAPPTEKSE